MEVEMPVDREGGILMEDLLVHIVLFENIIPDQTAGLPLASHVGYPAEGAVGIFSLPREMVLEEAPVGIYHEKAIVPDPLEIVNLVQVHSGLPGPFAHLNLLAVVLIEDNPVLELRESGLFGILDTVPLDGGTHSQLVALFRSKSLTELVPAFPAHHPVSSSQEANGSVAGTIREHGSLEAEFLSGLDIPDNDRGYLGAILIDLDSPEARQVGKSFLTLDESLFLVVLVIGGRLGVTAFRVAELPEHPAQGGIFPKLDESAEMNPDLRGIVSSGNRTVVHKGDLAAESGGGDGRAHPGHTASNHHEIIFPTIGRLSRQSTDRTAESLKISDFRRRDGPLILRQPDGVAASVKASQVGKRKGGLAGLQLDAS